MAGGPFFYAGGAHGQRAVGKNGRACQESGHFSITLAAQQLLRAYTTASTTAVSKYIDAHRQ